MQEAKPPDGSGRQGKIVVTNIPFNAIGSASSVQQQQTNEAIRAKRLQSQKNSHHAEDVQELDDTAVDSVGDEKQDTNHDNLPQNKKQKQEEDVVDIAALKELPLAPAPQKSSPSHLDISA